VNISSSSEGDGLSEDFCGSRDENGLTLGKRGRKENGLVTLTLRFIDLLRSSTNQTLDLNAAVEKLEV
jgi:hypothetical protein